MNASRWSSPNWSTRPRTGRTTAIAAPSAAPEAVPSTYGSASGFRSSPWNVAPATASPVPTTIAVRTRGSRRSITMASAVGAQLMPRSIPRTRLARIATVVAGARSTLPSTIPATSTTPSETTPATASQPARPSRPTRGRRASRPGAPAGSGVVVIGRRARSRRRRRQHEVRVDRQRERTDAVGEPRPRAGHDDVVDRTDGLVLDRAERLPAGPRSDLVGGDPVRGVAEEDDLGIEVDDLLGLDLVHARRAARERVATRDLDHLGAEVVLGRPEEPVRRVELVEHPRRLKSRGRGLDLVERGADVRGDALGLVGRPGGGPDELDVLERGGHVGREQDDHRHPQRAQLGDRFRRVEVGAPGDHEVGIHADDLLDVDGAELRDIGDVR